VRLAPVVDPDLIRSLEVGQAAYIYRGGVTYVQVKRLVTAPAALPAPGQAPTAAPAALATPATPATLSPRAAPAPAPPPLPDARPLLDQAFGAEPAP
jgi:hypothetical protein